MDEKMLLEAEYRRGYRDGYITALDTLAKMIHDRHMTAKEAIDACHHHGDNRLLRWMAEEPTDVVIAPEPTLWVPESPYDYHHEAPGEIRKLSDLMK